MYISSVVYVLWITVSIRQISDIDPCLDNSYSNHLRIIVSNLTFSDCHPWIGFRGTDLPSSFALGCTISTTWRSLYISNRKDCDPNHVTQTVYNIEEVKRAVKMGQIFQTTMTNLFQVNTAYKTVKENLYSWREAFNEDLFKWGYPCIFKQLLVILLDKCYHQPSPPFLTHLYNTASASRPEIKIIVEIWSTPLYNVIRHIKPLK